jgi:Gly-Xaa carboxypeptidase
MCWRQDTVPVPDSTIDQWTFPPWSGHFDGEFIWGRGACDCKGLLISHLVAIESLIEKDFKPQRTILLSYGFDEESKGFNVSLLFDSRFYDDRPLNNRSHRELGS